MALADGNADPALTSARARALARAEFFQTVRLILAARKAGLGDDTRPADEPVRFRVADGMRHPDAEIVALEPPAADDAPVLMTVGHMGLTGPMGVMPDHYTDLVVERRRARDEGMARFLDLFNHRAISLFYRAWAKYRLPVRFEEDGGGLADPFSRALAALAGVTRLDDPRLLAAAGPLARRVRSPGALKRIVAAMLTIPIEVVELRPRWIRIDPAEQTRLGSRHRPQGNFAQVGRNAVLGETAIDLAGRFRIRVGPLAWPDFAAFLHGEGIRQQLMDAVRLTVGPAVDFDVQLVLRADAVPPARLDATAPPMLSRDGWLLAEPTRRNRDDPVVPAVERGTKR